MKKPTLRDYINRYNNDKYLLEKHPENRDMLERRIRQHEKDIAEWVSSAGFERVLRIAGL